MIRPARVEDAEAIAGVHVRSWQAAYRGIVADGFLDALSVEDFAARHQRWLTEAQNPTLVSEREGSVLGFANLGPSRDPDDDPARVGEVYAIYLEPSAWGLGLGRELMAASRSLLRELGFQEATLWVLSDNQRARRFYFQDGWRVDGAEKPVTIRTQELAEVRYRRRLRPAADL